MLQHYPSVYLAPPLETWIGSTNSTYFRLIYPSQRGNEHGKTDEVELAKVLLVMHLCIPGWEQG